MPPIAAYPPTQPVLDDSHEIAASVITNVMCTADNGDLPLFAATLGIPSKEFAMLLDGQSQPLFQFNSLHAKLLADWLPGLFLPLVELLWDYQCRQDRLGWLVSHAVACACFGHRHLWQDLGLNEREDVTRLLLRHCPGLAARNTQNMKWKHFLFSELGKRLGQSDLEPPGCGGCDQVRACFPGRKESGIAFMRRVR